MTKVDCRELRRWILEHGTLEEKEMGKQQERPSVYTIRRNHPGKKSRCLPVPRPDQILDLKPISWKRLCVFKRKDPEHHDRCPWHIQPIGSDHGKNTRHFNKWLWDTEPYLAFRCLPPTTRTPESICWNPNPKYDGFGRLWEVIPAIWGHEVGPL